MWEGSQSDNPTGKRDTAVAGGKGATCRCSSSAEAQSEPLRSDPAAHCIDPSEAADLRLHARARESRHATPPAGGARRPSGCEASAAIMIARPENVLIHGQHLNAASANCADGVDADETAGLDLNADARLRFARHSAPPCFHVDPPLCSQLTRRLRQRCAQLEARDRL